MLLLLGVLLALASTSLADCPPDTIYETFFDKCYKYYNNPLPFLGAEKQCNSIGGNLVAVQSNIENSYVSGIASGATGRTPNFWVGANQLMIDLWSWTYNTSMSYTNWAPGQPGGAYPCGLIRDSDSKWITGACNTPLPFVCSVDPNAPQPGYCPTPTLQYAPTCPSSSCAGDAICPAGYSLYVGNCMCYKYINAVITYSAATIACANENATMVKIDTPELNDFLTRLPGFDCRMETCPWIGLQCDNSTLSTCRWPDGSIPVYTNFYTSEDILDNDHFALATNVDTYDSGKWEASTCSRSNLCQKPSTQISLLAATADKKKKGSPLQKTTSTR